MILFTMIMTRKIINLGGDGKRQIKTHNTKIIKKKSKARVHVIHRLRKRRPKNPRKNPPKRTEKVRKQRAEQKDEVVHLVTQPEHPRDRFRRKTKNKLKKEVEGEAFYLGT